MATYLHHIVEQAIASLVDPSSELRLKYLSIRGGGFSKPDFSADLSELMETVANNTALQTLDLSGNSFQDQVFVSLCKGLARNNLTACLLEEISFTFIELQQIRY
jgi:hypothetical protein